MRRATRAGLVVAAAVALVAGGCGADPDGETSDSPQTGQAQPEPAPQAEQPEVETVVEGLDRPWGLAFLPEGEQLLVTQAAGTLSVVDIADGEVRDLDGVPEVNDSGQGGLLDVALHPDYPESDWVYLSYSASVEDGGASTHLARGRLDLDAQELTEVEVLFVAGPARQGNAHYGSRLSFDPDGFLFMTLGDRGDKNFDDHPSQDPSNTLGTTIRLSADGSVPPDNPFVTDPDVADEIFSYGHRNVQGMAVHPQTGEVWQADHGERDGDAIYILEAGGNFGWPVAHTGCQYGTDTPVGDHPADRDDVVDPVYYWECGSGGFPPAGMTFYQGEEFPQWEGDLLIGGLAGEYLARFTVEGRQIEHAPQLLADEGWRIRDVAVNPHDGAVYLAVDGEDAPLIRLVNQAD